MHAHQNSLKKSLNNLFPILLLITVCTGILFFYKLDALSLFDVDEPRYAETARIIVETGDWITPRFNGEIRYDKPILFYWLIAISYKIFGINEFAARFWSATFATALVFFLFFLIKKFDSIRFALISSLILSTSAGIILLSRASITDMTLAFFISSSLFCFYLGYKSNEKIKKYYYLLFYVSMGLSTLTKGPVGIAIPFLVIIFFTLINGTFRSTLGELKIFYGLFTLAIIILPWNLAMFKLHGEKFINETFIRHNFTRFTGIVSGHRGSLFYFIPVIIIGFFPWSILLPSSISSLITRIKRTSLTTKEFSDINFFAFIWFLVVFIFFSISKTKLPTYITPLYPPMAILVGKLLDDILSQKNKISRSINLSVIILIISITVLSIIIIIFPALVNKFASDSSSSFFNSPFSLNYTPVILSIILITGISFFSFSWFTNLKKFSLYCLITTLFFFYFTCIIKIGPEIGKYRQSSLKNLSEFSRNFLKKEDKLISYSFLKPSIVFYSRHPVMKIDKKDIKQLCGYLNSDITVYVITKKSRLNLLPNTAKYYVLKEDGDFILISNQPVLRTTIQHFKIKNDS